MQLRLEYQRHPVADMVGALNAVVRPILQGVLYALQGDRVQRLGGYEAVTLADLAREYRAGDGDVGICFEYAVHDAVLRQDPLVYERIDGVLRDCRIVGDALDSILFGVEKTGSQRLIETAHEILTPQSLLMVGARGRPVMLRRHLERAARDFRNRQAAPTLPTSVRGIWKADLFLGRSDADRWVATTVKINPRQLEAAPGLRVGIVPASRQHDVPYTDEARNLIVCPLPHDGEFMEVFYKGWGIVRQVIDADAREPRPVALPDGADRQVARNLVDRRDFPVVDIVDVLLPLAQPELLDTEERQADLVTPDLRAGRSQNLGVTSVLAPVARIG